MRKGQNIDDGTITEFIVVPDQTGTFVCAHIAYRGSEYMYQFQDFEALKALGIDYKQNLVPSQSKTFFETWLRENL